MNSQIASGKGPDWKGLGYLVSIVSVFFLGAIAWPGPEDPAWQLPGPANSMGRIKFPFPNSEDIYLHDTPNKNLFASDDRTLSHGCIRLEDAERLGRWLMGHDPQSDSREPEQNVLLPSPVPIYVTYLTAQANNGQLSYVDDIYGRDREVATLQ